MASFLGGVMTYGATTATGGQLYSSQPLGLPTVPGAGLPNIGGGGEESSSTEPSDHVDDYGNMPIVPPFSWPGDPFVPPSVELPPAEEPWSGWTPPKIGPWQPPHFDFAPGERAIPWVKPPDEGGGVDLWPGAGEPPQLPELPDVTGAFDIAAMLPMMVMMMMFKD